MPKIGRREDPNIFNPYHKETKVADLKMRIARNKYNASDGNFKERSKQHKFREEYIPYDKPNFITRFKAEFKDYFENKPFKISRKKSQKVTGIDVKRARHRGKWEGAEKSNLPDLLHNIDGSLFKYLDKGKYGDSDVYEVPVEFKDGKDFRLYFKCLGAEDKKKELGDE